MHGIFGSNFAYLCFLHCPATGMKKVEASRSIILAGRAPVVKMLITLEPHGIFDSIIVYLCIVTLSSHRYEKGDEASPSIIMAGRAFLVQMLITLEPHGIFGSNFVYSRVCILTLSSHWYEKKVTWLHRASFLPVELFW